MFHNYIRREEDCKDTCRSKCEKHPKLCQLQLGVSLTSCISALCVFCSMLPSMDRYPLLTLSFFSLITPAFPWPTLPLLASLSPHPTSWPFPIHSHYHTGSSFPNFLNKRQISFGEFWEPVTVEGSSCGLVPTSRPISCIQKGWEAELGGMKHGQLPHFSW